MEDDEEDQVPPLVAAALPSVDFLRLPKISTDFLFAFVGKGLEGCALYMYIGSLLHALERNTNIFQLPITLDQKYISHS